MSPVRLLTCVTWNASVIVTRYRKPVADVPAEPRAFFTRLSMLTVERLTEIIAKQRHIELEDGFVLNPPGGGSERWLLRRNNAAKLYSSQHATLAEAVAQYDDLRSFKSFVIKSEPAVTPATDCPPVHPFDSRGRWIGPAA